MLTGVSSVVGHREGVRQEVGWKLDAVSEAALLMSARMTMEKRNGEWGMMDGESEAVAITHPKQSCEAIPL